MPLPDNKQKELHALCNAYTNSEINKAMDAVIAAIDNSHFDYDDDAEGKKLIGKIMALAYAKGYADCYENQKVMRLYV